jgi:UDP-2,3-diacylglucosamine pyrophosphatase LpxH
MRTLKSAMRGDEMGVHKKLYVISDLHIGGRYGAPNRPFDRGFRMCRNVPALAEFVHDIRRKSAKDGVPVELVINGDFVDFLAEEWVEVQGEPWRPFIQEGQLAAECLAQVIQRDLIFFAALKEFLADHHQLTLLLGNHDIELSLPQVRATLVEALCAEHRDLKFIYDGEAYVTGSVLIEHGNRYDSFNTVDHDRLRRTRSSQSRREHVTQMAVFNPPLGSLLVSGVMNRIKARYPFIDLLKPETRAAIPILLALAPEYRAHILYVTSLGVRSLRHGLDAAGTPMRPGEIAGIQSGELALESILLDRGIDPQAVEDFFQDLDATNARYDPSDKVTQGHISGGLQSTTWAYLSLLTNGASRPLIDRIGSLKTALTAAKNDFSFRPDVELPDYIEPARRLLSRGFDIVVFGHTHLAKHIATNEGTYINTGTWCDLIRFPFQMLDQPSSEATRSLQTFVHDLESGNMDEYIEFRPTFAEIDLFTDGRKPIASLQVFQKAEQ